MDKRMHEGGSLQGFNVMSQLYPVARGVGGSVEGVPWRVSAWPTAMVRTWPLVVYWVCVSTKYSGEIGGLRVGVV